jgi:type IV pilus assembly protein PilA
MRKQHRQAGFTIIEIMIVVTVIGVLAAIVLPTFRLDTARAKVSEAVLAFAPCKNMVTETYMSGGDPPLAGEQWGCEPTGQSSTYVSAIYVQAPEGIIRITLTGFNDLRIDTNDITLAPLDPTGAYPTSAGDQIKSWRCGSSLDGTTLDIKYLPTSCRGF